MVNGDGTMGEDNTSFGQEGEEDVHQSQPVASSSRLNPTRSHHLPPSFPPRTPSPHSLIVPIPPSTPHSPSEYASPPHSPPRRITHLPGLGPLLPPRYPNLCLPVSAARRVNLRRKRGERESTAIDKYAFLEESDSESESGEGEEEGEAEEEVQMGRRMKENGKRGDRMEVEEIEEEEEDSQPKISPPKITKRKRRVVKVSLDLFFRLATSHPDLSFLSFLHLL